MLRKSTQMVVNTQGRREIIRGAAKESLFIKMVVTMMANGKKIKCQEEEYI